MAKGDQRESELKAWVLDRLLDQARIDRRAILASEYAIPTEDLRADLAFLNSEFVGIEIKSPFDSLKRLPRQMQSYQRIFDHTILVCSSQHIVKVIDRFPNVELWEVTSDYNLVIHQEQSVSLRAMPDRDAISRLVARKSSVAPTPFEVDARECLIATFEDKFTDSSCRFWQSVRNRKIKSTDMSHLSRFLEQRAIFQAAQERKNQFWSDWQQQARDYFA